MIEDFDKLPELPAIYGAPKQIAYVVKDIDAAIKEWQAQGVGPFLVTRDAVPLSNAYYRGERAEEVRINIAFAYIDEMQLELIELLTDVPSLYKEALDRPITGVHHYAVCVEDFKATYDFALDEDGYESVIDSGVDGVARMSYMENREKGIILEVIEWNQMTKPFFNGIKKLINKIEPGKAVQEFELSELTPKVAVFLQIVKYFVRRLFGKIEKTRRPVTG